MGGLPCVCVVRIGGSGGVRERAGRNRRVSGWAVKLSFGLVLAQKNAFVGFPKMGQAFSGPPEHTFRVFRTKEALDYSNAQALSEDELDELVNEWLWPVCFYGITHPESSKPILEWVTLGIKYYEGWSVF